jgi:hypothetical protein
MKSVEPNTQSINREAALKMVVDASQDFDILVYYIDRLHLPQVIT